MGNQSKMLAEQNESSNLIFKLKDGVALSERDIDTHIHSLGTRGLDTQTFSEGQVLSGRKEKDSKTEGIE